MIQQNLKEITETDLEKLINDPVYEGKTIEYKREISLGTDVQKRKFLAGITSFANASGGDIVFGIAVKDGRPTSIQSLLDFNPDTDILRLRDIIHAHIEPKVFGIEFQAVSLAAGGYALVIRIRKPWAGAHMVTYNKDFRFYTRDLAGRRPMGVPEIRSAFTLAETTIEKINRFRLERLGNIIAGETPHPLTGNAFFVIHLLPLCSFDPNFRCNLTSLRSDWLKLRPLYTTGCDPAEDFDGFFTYNAVRGEASSYCSISRNGCIEAVETYLLTPTTGKFLATQEYENETIMRIPDWFEALQLAGVEPPIMLMVSLLGVKGYSIYTPMRFRSDRGRPINRDQLLVPGVLVETLEIPFKDRTENNNVFDLMRPIFDTIWNACGYRRSMNFDANGNWNPPR